MKNHQLIDNTRLKSAFFASLYHLAFSALLAGIAALLVFGFWYPYPYRNLSGGFHLFWIMVGVDIICGPLITAIVFNPKKSRTELTLDLSLVIFIQLAALTYGVYSIASARPVILAFEVDRMVTVAAVQIDEKDLQDADKEFQSLSWTGPRLVGTRSARNNHEWFHSLEQSIQGVEPSARPSWWQPYVKNLPDVKKRMKKITELHSIKPSIQKKIIEDAVEKTGMKFDDTYYLPLVYQKSLDNWIVLLDSEGNIKGYAPVGGFL